MIPKVLSKPRCFRRYDMMRMSRKALLSDSAPIQQDEHNKKIRIVKRIDEKVPSSTHPLHPHHEAHRVHEKIATHFTNVPGSISSTPVSSILSSVPEEVKESKAAKATKVGAAVNVVLAICKGLVGYSISSTGLIADAANSVSDLLIDAVVFYSMTEARRGSNQDSPWGRGKVESIGALAVGGVLMSTGVGLGYMSLNSAIDMHESAMEHLLATGEMSSAMMLAGLGVAGISVVAKETLYRYTIKAGTEENSASVIANAWQHRGDAFISSAVFIGILGTMNGHPLLDPLAGLLVSGVIVKQAFSTGMEALKDLSDAPATKEETNELRKTCQNVQGVRSVENILARKSGPFLYVEVVIGVLGTMSASAAHRIGAITRSELLEKHKGRVANAVVNVHPIGSTGLGERAPLAARDHDALSKEIADAVTSMDDVISVSEVQLYYMDSGMIDVKVDVYLSPKMTILNAHLIAGKAKAIIKEKFPFAGQIDVDLELDETNDYTHCEG